MTPEAREVFVGCYDRLHGAVPAAVRKLLPAEPPPELLNTAHSFASHGMAPWAATALAAMYYIMGENARKEE